MHVFGTETHMTAIVGMALGKAPIVEAVDPGHTANFLLGRGSSQTVRYQLKTSFIATTSVKIFRCQRPAYQGLDLLQNHRSMKRR